MNAASLRAQLEMPYDLERWRTLLPELLPGVELFSKPQNVPLTSDAQKTLASRRRQFGRARVVDAQGVERVIAFFEVDVKPNVQLTRNRVSLRQIVATCIDEATAHAMLAFFVQPGTDSYRLTYAARESRLDEAAVVRTEETAAKRFTYVLGPGVPCRTAADRLAGLGSDPTAVTLAKVTEAFSVEKLSNEFFEQYRKVHYAAFCSHLIDASAPADIFGIKLRGLQGKERDKALKPVRDFVKKLLGRLVFLHFLQKKGWLGCPPDRTDWTDGDPQFLKNLFATCATKDRFYNQTLVPLFFDTLNNPNRKNDLFVLTKTRIPYLNGGLFERDFDGVEQIDFPATLFADLLDFFGQYNFTIDENDPDDHEIGIDPEMLGHIFENLLEDNKDKGAYYTPKPVVQYMCQQSLIYYLQSRVGGDEIRDAGYANNAREGEAPAEPQAKEREKDIARESIEKLVRHKDPINPKDKSSWLAQNARAIEQALDEVKICDPAIGSGAFPIGLLQEIYWTKLTLHPAMDRAKAKRDIIQKSIHGVDIDAGAVEIARLRCWLALIVEEDQPRPLPNLDFKIMQGDSLLESFEGIPLDKLLEPEAQRITLIGDQQELEMPELRKQLVLTTAAERKKLTDLMDRYFGETDPVKKAEIHRTIDKAVRDHIDYNIRLQREQIETELHQHKADIAFKKKRLAAWEPPTKTQKRIDHLQQALKENRLKADRLHALEHRPERPFFLWRLFFQDVFERGGFDIVIANPPYGAITAASEIKDGVNCYRVASGNPDSYALFIELSGMVTKSNGIVCMIVPTGWYSGKSFTVLRHHFAEVFDPFAFTNLPYDVFRDAWVDTTIFVCQKRVAPAEWPRTEACPLVVRIFPKRFKLFSSDDFFTERHEIDFCDWFRNGKDDFLTAADPAALAIMNIIMDNSRPLSNYADIQRGVTPFKLTDKPVHKNSKTAFNGTIRRYQITDDGLRYIRYDESLAEYKPERYFKGSRILLRELISRQFRLQAMLVESDFVTNKSMQTLLAKDDEPRLKYLLAVLNSSVLSWYFMNRSNIANRDDFPKIVLDETRNLPVPEADEDTQEAIVTLVERLLAAKQSDDQATADALDREIDEQVAKLYGLTPKEIAIIGQQQDSA